MVIVIKTKTSIESIASKASKASKASTASMASTASIASTVSIESTVSTASMASTVSTESTESMESTESTESSCVHCILDAEQKYVAVLEKKLEDAEARVAMLKAKLAAATTCVNDLAKRQKEEGKNPPIKYPKLVICPPETPHACTMCCAETKNYTIYDGGDSFMYGNPKIGYLMCSDECDNAYEKQFKNLFPELTSETTLDFSADIDGCGETEWRLDTKRIHKDSDGNPYVVFKSFGPANEWEPYYVNLTQQKVAELMAQNQ